MAINIAGGENSMQESINKIDWAPTEKQFQTWKYLTDKTTTEIFFGGGA